MRALMIILLMTGSATADSGSVIGETAQACWSLPSGTDFGTMSATFDVETDDSGSVLDIAVKDYSPVSEEGKVFVRSASLAIERCAPYEVTAGGNHSVIMTIPSDTAPIDPFKAQ